ncbi:MAG TPA: redox-sensing transcriptional repressor Rex [Planctomycetota bacterium]|nr:redox-sensing transcriptional repressor Rex [Planctomycetota bacterium]
MTVSLTDAAATPPHHTEVNSAAMRRLSKYHGMVEEATTAQRKWITSAEMARALGVDESQVRKDLAPVGVSGKPRRGFSVDELRTALETFMGFNEQNAGVLIGVGHLGTAIARYPGFKRYGLKIVALFDADKAIIGRTVGALKVQPMADLDVFLRHAVPHIGIAVLTLPPPAAGPIADQLIEAGVKAIWNFSGKDIPHRGKILVKNEDLASSMAALSYHLRHSALGREV